MDTEKFLRKSKELVADYTLSKTDKTDDVELDPEDVYVVWSTKVLQNNKALLSTPLFDDMYYEVTYNGDKNEIYFDAYKKFENVAHKL